VPGLLVMMRVLEATATGVDDDDDDGAAAVAPRAPAREEEEEEVEEEEWTGVAGNGTKCAGIVAVALERGGGATAPHPICCARIKSPAAWTPWAVGAPESTCRACVVV